MLCHAATLTFDLETLKHCGTLHFTYSWSVVISEIEQSLCEIFPLLMPKAVPEENLDFCANLTFSRKIAIFRKFRLGAQFFARIWHLVEGKCSAKVFARRYLCFPAKVRIFCAGLAHD